MMKNKNFILVMVLLLLAIFSILLLIGRRQQVMEKEIKLEDGRIAYVAIAGDMEFVLVTDTEQIIDKIKININSQHGEYNRSGNWKDKQGIEWNILYSIKDDNSITINSRNFVLRLGRVFELNSESGVVQIDDSKFNLDENISSDQIEYILNSSGLKTGEEKNYETRVPSKNSVDEE